VIDACANPASQRRRRQTFDIYRSKIAKLFSLGCWMQTTLTPRTVLLTMLYIIVSLSCQAVVYCMHLLRV
jgi:hypothetical protein